jgi:hypothetical protein
MSRLKIEIYISGSSVFVAMAVGTALWSHVRV